MRTLIILTCLTTLCSAASSAFSSGAQTDILKAHNDMRRKLAKAQLNVRGIKKSGASNMRQLKWDPTLASAAQDLSAQCESVFASQNGITYLSIQNVNNDPLDGFGVSAVASWFQTMQDFGWESNTFDAKAYTYITGASQALWASTGAVGCGVTNCGFEEGGFEEYDNIMVVCKYSAAGNIGGQLVYNTGAACSACPSGTTCNDGLCA